MFVDGIQFGIDLGVFMLNRMSLMNRALYAVACVFIFEVGTLFFILDIVIFKPGLFCSVFHTVHTLPWVSNVN